MTSHSELMHEAARAVAAYNADPRRRVKDFALEAVCYVLAAAIGGVWVLLWVC